MDYKAFAFPIDLELNTNQTAACTSGVTTHEWPNKFQKKLTLIIFILLMLNYEKYRPVQKKNLK